MAEVFIERHYSLSVSEFEGLWEMTLMHPFNREEHLTIYVEAPNSDYDSTSIKDIPIAKAGEKFSEILTKLLLKIESYPYHWDLSGKKIVSYGYDFQTDFSGDNMGYIELTEIAFREVNEYYNFFSPLDVDLVEEDEKISGKGVMTKLKISLNKQSQVNHLTIDFFTQYPIELLSFMYQSEKDGPIYELPLNYKETNGTIVFHFPAVYASYFYLIIKQESYTIQNNIQNDEASAKAIIWQTASATSKAAYESVTSDYLEQVLPIEWGESFYQDIVDSYKNIDSAIAEPAKGPFNSYNMEFNQAKEKLDSVQR